MRSRVGVRGLLLAVFWIGTAGHLRGQETNVFFEQITIKDGLSQSVVTCIAEDRQGFMWFGTQSGLNRFDGYSFVVYKNMPWESNTMSDNHIRSILVGRAGEIWIGTDGGGLNRYDPQNGAFVSFVNQSGDPASLSHNTVRCLYEDSGGTLWVGTDDGLDRFDRNRNVFFHYCHDSSDTNSLGRGVVRAICMASAGCLWIATDDGIDLFDPRSGRFRHFRHNPADPSSLSSGQPHSLYRDRGGRLWVGVVGGGLNRLDERTGRFTVYSTRNSGISNDFVRAIAEDPSGFIWAGTDDGLNRLDPQSGKIRIFHRDPGLLGSPSHNEIMCLYADKAGILWVGTYTGGINKFVRGKAIFSHQRFTFPPPASESQNHVWSILEDRRGDLWVGTTEGLNRMDRRLGTITRFRHDARDPASLSNDTVRALSEDQDGFLWAGTDDGLNRLDPRSGRFTRFTHDARNPHSLSNNGIMALLVGGDGTLWVGTDGGGLDRLVRGSGDFVHYRAGDRPDSLSSNDIFALYEDRDGALWVGTAGAGLNKLEPRSRRFIRYRYDPGDRYSISGNAIFSISEDSRGTIWVGTRGAGLDRFNRDSGRFTCFSEREGLASNAVCGILVDEHDRLWISTFNGLSRFDPEQRTFKNFDYRNGLQSNEFNQGAFFRNRSGELFFGGIYGYNSFYPRSILKNRHMPAVFVTAMRVFGKSVNIGPTMAGDREIVLAHNQNFLSFEFVALDFSIPEKNRFACKLDGVDRNWVFTDARKRFADYTNLDPGRYTFRVRGANADGVWNWREARVRIRIVPPFWRTAWFGALAVLAFALVSYFAIGHARKYLGLIRFWRRKNFISHYRVIEQIASGGMGTIFKAVDVLGDLNRPVAIKVMKDELVKDALQRKRFMSEATIIDQLDLPHVVKIIERGEYNQNLFIAMELLNGETLACRMRREHRLDIPAALNIMAQLAEVMFQMHSRGFIHRDLKPENIMLVESAGSSDYVKLLDFGLARAHNVGRLTESGMVVGTINYLSPEQVARAEFSFASDVYALGVIFYDMVTGEKPFSGETTVDIMRQIMDKIPVSAATLRPELDPELSCLIAVMMAKDAQLRPHIAEVLAEIRLVQSRVVS